MDTYASWIASAATMVAAMMTAANLGTRITGWGFVVFTIGSVAWAVVGLGSGQTSLLITNAFLFCVNLFGVWRWLGRQARYEQGSAAATEDSKRHRHVPTLFSGATMIGANVSDSQGKTLGTIIDTMLACDTKQLSYIVIASGGVGGVGEALRALSPRYVMVDANGVRCTLTANEVEALPSLNETEWPAVAPEAPAEVEASCLAPVAAQV